MSFKPTPEQEHILDLYKTGQHTVVEALAGTGKTLSLKLCANYMRSRRGLYIAFNKSVAAEARVTFAGTQVKAVTAHALAFPGFGAPRKARLNTGKYVHWTARSEVAGIQKHHFDSSENASVDVLARETLSDLAVEAIKRFIESDAPEITENMAGLPPMLMVTAEGAARLKATVVGYAKRLWNDAVDLDGSLPITHAHYLKMYQLSCPRLNYEYIMLDEAQDADPVMAAIIKQQQTVQQIVVGDSNQAIYEWRNAIDVLKDYDGQRGALTQSFRFGEAIADEANLWLRAGGSPMEVKGLPSIASTVGRSRDLADAILCRSNAGAIKELMDAQQTSVTTAIAGDRKAEELRKFALAAEELRETGSSGHPDFATFKSWSDLVDFSNSTDGASLAPLVKTVDSVGTEAIVSAIDRTVSSEAARVTISTAHIAKGLEWDRVRISDDFFVPSEIEDLEQEEARLGYVSVTRAKQHLDPGPLRGVRKIVRTTPAPALV
ncbi:3'-5' exonuclease [Lysinibacter cavernae]|uniref:3'-5' exonuclease n=1 Tax=Lysinibacter cavernae TaxID=1640652 RepID=UPI003621A5D7